MESNLEKSTKQTKTQFVVEDAPESAMPVGKVNEPEPDDTDSLDAVEETEQDIDLDDEIDLELEDDEPEVPEQPKEKPKQESAQPKQASKEQRKIQALKNQALKLQQEKADLEKRLAEKRDAEHKTELVSKYVNKGFDEADAKERADADIRQSNMEKQLELLMFEKQNRKVLAKYPDADNDLDKIRRASESSGMTVEQVCRGLYGAEIPEREKRAIAALTDSGDSPARNGSVSKSITSAGSVQNVKLNKEQMEIKRYLERLNKGKPISNEDVIRFSEG